MAIGKFLQDISRVWKVTRKPTSKEYWLTAKVVLIGFLIIGLIGFIMEFIYQLLIKRLFF